MWFFCVNPYVWPRLKMKFSSKSAMCCLSTWGVLQASHK
jgi:hypothetical protein